MWNDIYVIIKNITPLVSKDDNRKIKDQNSI